MHSDHSEIEVKFYVPDLDVIARRLNAVGAVLTAPRVFERNVRYENADHTLTAQGIVVRLREDSRVRLTYKEPLSDLTENGVPVRFEAEVEVSNFDTMSLILERLGYMPYLVYEKYRTTYELDGAEIVLDEMPYGNFVEIEGNDHTIRQATERLALQNAHRLDANYVSLFARVKAALGLDFHDLTFENFDGIVVPEAAFDVSN